MKNWIEFNSKDLASYYGIENSDLFKNYLLETGVLENQIISFELDLTKDIKYRNPLELASYVREMVEGKEEKFYLEKNNGRYSKQ